MKRAIFILLSLLIVSQLEGQVIIRAQSAVTSRQSAPASTEMLTNGELTGGVSWGQTGGFTLTGDVAVFDDLTNGSIYQLPGNMVSNVVATVFYVCEFDVTGTSGGGIYMLISGADNGDGPETYVPIAEYNNGHKTVIFQAPADVRGGGFRFSASTVGDSGGTINNISLKPQ